MTDMKPIVGPDGLFTSTFLGWLEDQPDSVLLETARPDRSEFRSHVFCKPLSTIECNSLNDAEKSLREVEHAVGQGLHAAGFMTYELGYAFEECFSGTAFSSKPLMWFGIYEGPWTYNHRSKNFESGEQQALEIANRLGESCRAPTIHELEPSPSIREEEFRSALERIKQHIRDGSTYQVNFSFRMRFPWTHPAADLYCQLRGSQRVPYSAFLKLPDTSILSFSPELFFRMQGQEITFRPMKGTAPRGRIPEEDELNRRALLDSAKDRAENVMIVDLLRNDIGRIAEVGTVSVPEYYAVEEFETVYQATSVIEARMSPACPFPEVIRCVFPSGSVTGAPKIRTMQIIHELEKESRGVYTGCVGFFAPQRRAVFNVAIRTLVLDSRQQQAQMGVGSGVTYDSDIAGEYQECLDKARFLGGSLHGFELLETIKWEPLNGWFLLEEHLRRAGESASYFGFSFDLESIRDSLRLHERELQVQSEGRRAFRVRLALDKGGVVRITQDEIAAAQDIERVAIAFERIDSRNRFLYHKTTNRQFYDRALRCAAEMGLFDLFFSNQRGEVTEGARSNVIIRKGKEYHTPPVRCGLLPGVFRQHLFDSRDFDLRETVLHPEDLAAADAVFLCNSVRGLQRVEIIDSPSRF